MTPPETAAPPASSLTHRELKTVAEMTGCHFDGRRLQLPFFGDSYTLTTTETTGSDGSRISEKINETLRYYVANFPAKPPREGHLVSYRELKDAGPLVVSFANNTVKTITAAFSGKRAELESAARSLGGVPRPDPPGYDLQVEFKALPGIPLHLQFNDAESPFPAQCTLLLDASIESYLDMEAIFTLGTFLCGRLIASCYI